MDFENERYIRIYVRDTLTWKRLGWHGQNVLMQVLRRMDLSGVLDLDGAQPWEVPVIFCSSPEEDARIGMAKCLELGCFVENGPYLVAPRYREANEAKKSDRQRQLESRGRRRSHALSPAVTVGHAESQTDPPASRIVTPESQSVTPSHSASHPVTPTGSGSGSGTVAEQDPTRAKSAGSQKLTGVNGHGAAATSPLELRGEDVSARWNREAQTFTLPGQAYVHWRADYESIAAVCNGEARRDEADPQLVLDALVGYFWRAAEGPIKSGRIQPSHATPAQLAKHIVRDLEAAYAWHASQRRSPPRADADHREAV